VLCANAVLSLGGSLGSDPSCTWSSPSILTVAFGSGATIVEGDVVRFKAGAGTDVRSANGVSAAIAQQVNLANA
jgi:hypothetical protein